MILLRWSTGAQIINDIPEAGRATMSKRGSASGEGSGEGCSPEKGRVLLFLDEVVCHDHPARLRDHDHKRANDWAWSAGHALPRHQYTAPQEYFLIRASILVS